MPAAKIPQIGDLFLGRLENAGKIANVLVLVDPKLEGFPQLTFTTLATTDLVFVTSPDDPVDKEKEDIVGRSRRGPMDLEPGGLPVL